MALPRRQPPIDIVPVARFRISKLAQSDLRRILATSEKEWGIDARHRYAALLNAGMRCVADNPEGTATRDRSSIHHSTRSFHLRHVRTNPAERKVKKPVHILYFRSVRPGLIEIVRVLHERMDPERHLSPDFKD
jgi:toxin ParE1/3/4